MQTSEHVRTVSSTSGTWERTTTTTTGSRRESRERRRRRWWTATTSRQQRRGRGGGGGRRSEEGAGAGSRSESRLHGWTEWLLLIPDYDGCPHGLDNFAESVRWVCSRLGRGLERGLLLGLGAKLRGEARRSYRHKLQRFASVEHFLRALYWQFSGVGAEAWLLKELRSAHQRDQEPLPEYARRLDKLAVQLCTIYGFDDREKDIVEESALVSFRRGLASPELELCLAAAQPKSFDEALPLAIAFDRQLRHTIHGPIYAE